MPMFTRQVRRLDVILLEHPQFSALAFSTKDNIRRINDIEQRSPGIAKTVLDRNDFDSVFKNKLDIGTDADRISPPRSLLPVKDNCLRTA